MPASSSVGINLATINYWSTEFPFLDRVKSAGQWTTWGNTTPPLSANGYPTSLPNGAVYLMVPLDPANAGTSKIYELTYTGTASFRVTAAKIISSVPGKIVFEYTGTGSMDQIILNSVSSTDPLTSLHIVRQDQVAAFKSGEIFNSALLDKLSAFDTLRFMDWTNTNNSKIKSWADRTTMDDMNWSVSTTNGSVPIEAQVMLANKLHKNMWINIPTEADDDYVRKTLQYVKDNLDPSLKVEVEYSNEVWNWSFQQSRYARGMADKLWGKDVNHDGVIDPNNAAEAVAGGFQQYYGYRSAQIAAIGQQVFGANSPQLKPVLVTQTVYAGLERYIFAGIDRAGVGTAADLFKDYAVTTYFGDSLTGQTASDRTTILGWANAGAAGIDAAFRELEFGGTLQAKGTLASLKENYAYQGAVAQQQGLSMVAYEGGLGLWATNFAAADQPKIMEFFAKLENDPRMGALYTQMVADFAAAGGTLLNAYTDAAFDRAAGNFGTLKSIYDETSPAYQALKDAQIMAQGGTAGPVRQNGFAAGYTSDVAYTLAATESNITYNGVAAFKAVGNELANVITGGFNGNRLEGGGGNDQLIGGAGVDYLDGGTGADTMRGKGGDDTYIVDNADDQVVENASEGTDLVRTTLASYALTANVENLTFTGTGVFTGTGNALDNVLTAGDGGSTLSGGAGNDSLVGGRGRDILDGGTGNDTMSGGAGDDSYVVDSAGDVVVEAADGGIDEVRTTLSSYSLAANLENLTYTGSAAFAGTGNDAANILTGGKGANSLSGGGGNDTLIGGNANDTLNGGTGNDTMSGGAGNDIYIVDSTGDVLNESANQGTDEVRTTLTAFALGANLENLSYTGASFFTGTGNALANVITAGNGGSQLSGGDGADTLNGGSGADLIDGGTGADRMSGGAGNDNYVVDNAGDIVVEAANGGIDDVRTTIASYGLTANVENLMFTGTGTFTGGGNASDNVITGGAGINKLYGNEGNDTLLGGISNDTLDGGSGVDRMTGGRGDDGYVVDNTADVIVERAGEGNDSVYATATYTLSDNVENLQLMGTGAFDATGNDLANNLRGNAAANRLYGRGGNDLIMAGAGDDLLDGGDGADYLLGEDGNDTLAGGADNDILNGGAGNDTLMGGAGADSLSGGIGADRFVFGPGDLSPIASLSDKILDFSRAEGDKIDLSRFDANVGTVAKDSFRFIGTGGFTKQAGQLRVDNSGFYAVLSGDLNGDGVADFKINVSKGSGGLIASDFIL